MKKAGRDSLPAFFSSPRLPRSLRSQYYERAARSSRRLSAGLFWALNTELPQTRMVAPAAAHWAAFPAFTPPSIITSAAESTPMES